MKASSVSSRFYTGKIRQLDESIRCNSRTETPFFRITGFEIGECLSADRVDKNIARLSVQSFTGPGKLATELFELFDIHGHTVRRLTLRFSAGAKRWPLQALVRQTSLLDNCSQRLTNLRCVTFGAATVRTRSRPCRLSPR